jgi:hypothetical protein
MLKHNVYWYEILKLSASQICIIKSWPNMKICTLHSHMLIFVFALWYYLPLIYIFHFKNFFKEEIQNIVKYEINENANTKYCNFS